MNIFLAFFFPVWVASAVYLAYQFYKYLRQRRNRKACVHCKHFPDCANRQELLKQDLPLPVYCGDFQRREKERRKA